MGNNRPLWSTVGDQPYRGAGLSTGQSWCSVGGQLAGLCGMRRRNASQNRPNGAWKYTAKTASEDKYTEGGGTRARETSSLAISVSPPPAPSPAAGDTARRLACAGIAAASSSKRSRGQGGTPSNSEGSKREEKHEHMGGPQMGRGPQNLWAALPECRTPAALAGSPPALPAAAGARAPRRRTAA